LSLSGVPDTAHPCLTKVPFSFNIIVMGLYGNRIRRLRLDVPEHLRDLYTDFNKLCILRNEKPLDLITSWIRKWLSEAPELQNTWLPWEQFQDEMRLKGYSLNRTTIYNYRKNGAIGNYVVTDGTSTLYQVEGILSILKGEAV
jgi:hypothetical protein